jgi:hypothetical protein
MFFEAYRPVSPIAELRQETHLVVIRTALAASLYNDEHGRYPRNLDDLIPRFRQRPIDLFSGRPLRVRKIEKRFVIYSVGRNQVDDGGVGRLENEAGKDDLRVRLPIAPKR